MHVQETLACLVTERMIQGASVVYSALAKSVLATFVCNQNVASAKKKTELGDSERSLCTCGVVTRWSYVGCLRTA